MSAPATSQPSAGSRRFTTCDIAHHRATSRKIRPKAQGHAVGPVRPHRVTSTLPVFISMVSRSLPPGRACVRAEVGVLLRADRRAAQLAAEHHRPAVAHPDVAVVSTFAGSSTFTWPNFIDTVVSCWRL
jgi:hypothetical protein